MLEGVHYSIQPGVSRLTMSFEGPIAYSSTTAGDRIVLCFGHTSVASPPGAARLAFKDGLVRSLTIDRMGVDSTRLTVVLREGTSYTMVRSAEKQLLSMDVVTRASGPAAASAPARPAPQRRTVPGKKPDQESRLVDIPALARSEAADRGAQPAASAATAREESRRVTSLSPILLLGSMVGIALLGTLALLAVAAKKQIGVRDAGAGSVRPVQPPTVQSPPREETRPAEPDETEDADQQEEMEPAETDEPMIEGSSRQLAKMFRRGQEELQLVARLHAGINNASGKKVARVCSSTSTRTQRAHAAKKLGIGRGEIDLVLHLQALAEERVKGEETL